jgi:hypothetical protein
MLPDKGRTFVSQSISFPPELLANAKDRAGRLGLPFSTYVQKCIERDLESRDPIVFAEREPAPELLVAEDPAPAARAKPGSTKSK